VAAFKGGIASAVTDFDYFRFESDGAVLFVVAEEASTVHAYIASDLSKEGEFIQCTGKLPPGTNVISVSVGPLQVTNSSNFVLLVAVAIFDHCGVEFFELSRTPSEPKKLTLIPRP
jgi:hypothetical protein